ncbi:hypothetical protein KEM48_004686, partial [Puccinia striiformis f. sp. tritici PST-130]
MAQSSSHPESSEPTLSTNPTRPPSANQPESSHPSRPILCIFVQTTTPAGLWQRQKAPRSAAKSPKQKRAVVNNSDESSEANSDSGVAIMDLAQDSDKHNSKMEPPTKKPKAWQFQSSTMLCCILNHLKEPKGIQKGRNSFISASGVQRLTSGVSTLGRICVYIGMEEWDGPLALVEIQQSGRLVPTFQRAGRT